VLDDGKLTDTWNFTTGKPHHKTAADNACGLLAAAKN
jgi:hypothetical protein